ncbi:MAG: DEAD/DEAH box helicase [Proteobacteria bacterium]|nr:DEAD/DEAH box helicase [Pseudomonadota bacterium]
MVAKNSQDSTEIARVAIRWLADRCDGARSDDSAGFSQADVLLGHALADKEIWTPRETLAALNLTVKYGKQLSKGGVNLDGTDLLRAALQKSIGDQGRLRKRDIVTGKIWVEESRIQIRSGFHRPLVDEQRELIGARWDANAKQWSCDLCAENAASVEDMAQRYGLVLQTHKEWDALTSMRSVVIDGDRLVIRGVNAKAIFKSLPAADGQPEKDERVFRAIELRDLTAIAIPLTSWVVREALLWLDTADDDNCRRLAWARDRITQLLQDTYPQLLVKERQRFDQASAVDLPNAQTTFPSLPPKLADGLMPHQWVAVRALSDHKQSLLADEQGLGKTIEIIATLENVQAFPAVILAPATALLNWRDEITAWLPHRKVSVRGGGVAKKDEGGPITTAEFIVLNYESFTKFSDQLETIHPKALVADEAQYLKGYDSARTEAVVGFCRSSGVERIIAATGTPVMNRPSELLTLLTLLPSMLTELGGFWRFASRYCRATLRQMGFNSIWDFGGADNLGELANRISETGRFIRRTKTAVLPDLAQKQRQHIDVKIDNRGDYDEALNDFSEWLKTHNTPRKNKMAKRPSDDETILQSAATWLGWAADEVVGMSMDTNARTEALRRMTVLRQLAGRGKIAAAVDWIRERVKDEKLVVFAYHIEVQQALVERLGGDPLTITGDMSLKARHAAIKRFQQDPAARLIVCSLKAAQTAITLTAARYALFVELDWTPSSLAQAEDRIHRIGQDREVNIAYLCASNTFDERMLEILGNKQVIIDALTTRAEFGYRKDGLPRQQRPGPGRPRLDQKTGAARRTASKSGWQARNPDYMAEYMRKRRLEQRIKSARILIYDLNVIERLGVTGMQRELGDRSYGQIEFERELKVARAKAEKAKEFLATNLPIELVGNSGAIHVEE